jgi:putative transposase
LPIDGMGNGQRSIICGGTYHVMNRGNRKQPIFEDDRDRRRFLRILTEEIQTHGVDLLSGCLMLNHFHLVVCTPNGNLSDFMERLEGEFARYSNWRHNHVGHLFQGPFRDVLIEHDIHLFIAMCYVFANPVAAGLVRTMDAYKWSTYAATVGRTAAPSYLTLDWVETLCPGQSLEESQQRFRLLMEEAKPVTAYLRHDFDIDHNFLKRAVRSYVGGQLQVGSLPHAYRSALRSSLDELFADRMSFEARSAAIYDARVLHGYKLAEIASHLKIHRNTASAIFRSESQRRLS